MKGKQSDDKGTRSGDGFRLRMDCVRPGDVILTGSPGQIVSAVIRTAARSPFSHAIFVLEVPYGIESSDWGVVKFRLDRFLVHGPENILIRRLLPNPHGRFDTAKAVQFVKQCETAEYAHRDMLTALFRRIPQRDPGKFFCSQLVAAAFRAGGVEIVPGIDPSKVTPAMLAASKVLETVSDCLVRVDCSKLEFEPSWFDGPSHQSPHEAEVAARQRAFTSMRERLEKHNLRPENFEDALHLLFEAHARGAEWVSELDKEVAGAMMASGMMRVAAEEFPAYADQFFIDFELIKDITSRRMPAEDQRRLLQFYREEGARVRMDNEKREEAVKALRKAYLASNLEVVRLRLANEWEMLGLGKRMEAVISRAVKILEDSLDQARDEPGDR